MMKKRNKLFALGMAVLLGLTACTGGADAGKAGQSSEEDRSSKEERETNETSKNEDDDILSDMEGEWKLAYTIYHSHYEDEEDYESVTMSSDPYTMQSDLKIHKEGEKYVADYRTYGDEYMGGTDRMYGNELILRNEPAYEGCENDEWSVVFKKVFDDDEEIVLALIDDDTLIRYDEYVSDDPEWKYKSTTVYTYLKKDSPKFDNIEDLRYFDTVTVSDTVGLLDAIKNNTKIILKAGKYDLSNVAEEAIKNENITFDYDGVHVSYISNVCLEAEEGAEVLISTTKVTAPVLNFQGGGNITLRNLTVGHDVEPGMCSGSVVRCEYFSGLNIEKCKLYGSGTYGVEAQGCSYVNVIDTDIYECTYGLVDLTNSSTVTVRNCELRDSSGFAMFELSGCYDILFEDCKIHDNDSTAFEYSDGRFIVTGEYGNVTFRNCEFKNNRYKEFSDRADGVTLDKCTIDNH